MQYRKAGVIGGKGSASNQFRSLLRGVSVDGAGVIYAAGDREVKAFDQKARLIRRWRTQQPAISVAVGPDGRLFVGESGQIEIFSQAGRLLTAWNDPLHLGLVTAIGITAQAVFVADSRGRCIRRFDHSGKYLLSMGQKNRMKGFSIPNGYLDLALDIDGTIHVANPGKHRVERYSPEGDLLGWFGKFGMRDPANFRGCCNPINVAVSNKGELVVTEKAGPRAKVYSADGKLLALIGEEEFDPNCKYMDIAVDHRGSLYIADSVRRQIGIFSAVEGSQSELQKSSANETERD